MAAILATIPEFFIQRGYNLLPVESVYSSSILLAFAFIEESIKFAVVYLIVRRSQYFDEKIDSMIYMITAGLGFAALENILILTDPSLVLAEVATLRSIGATLLHAFASGILGFYWARGRLWLGVAAATTLHWGFNYLVLLLPNPGVYVALVLFLAAIFLFHNFEILKEKDILETNGQKADIV